MRKSNGSAEKLSATAAVDELSTQPLPNSSKIYVEGSRPDIRVAMREVSQSPTHLQDGGLEENPPVRIYDTSGPYTDPEMAIDVRKGLAPLRRDWVLEREDTVELDRFTSDYTRLRDSNLTLEKLRFEHTRKPRRALPGQNVTQLHYARRGIITPEMEYIAIRENLALEQAAVEAANREQHPRAELWRQYTGVRHPGICAQRGGRGPRGDPRQYQPPGERAHDHRPQFPGEDQRQYRQQRRHLLYRGGSGEDGLVHPLGWRYSDGSVHRRQYPRDPGVDCA